MGKKLTIMAVCGLALASAGPAFSGPKHAADPTNALRSAYTPAYLALKSEVLAALGELKPGRFSETEQGLKRDNSPARKVLALTFDACGGRYSGYNAALIDYLRKEKLPATLFVSGLWIEKNRKVFLELAKDPLFEIENHGLLHRACSITGRTKYKVVPTRNAGDVVDEIELNARKIDSLTGRRPVFFRPATAFADEASVRIAERLGMELVSYDILSGDAMHASAGKMSRNIIEGAKHGAIVIMHFHRPEWKEVEALKSAVPVLREKGYTFDKLENFPFKQSAEAGPGGKSVQDGKPGEAKAKEVL